MENVLDANSKLSEYVVCGAKLSCTLGTAKSNLKMPISHGVFLKDIPQCNINDRVPLMNILSFGSCNRSVPPPPCIPATPLPWMNKKDILLFINGSEALIKDAICSCSFGGIISIDDSGQI